MPVQVMLRHAKWWILPTTFGLALRLFCFGCFIQTQMSSLQSKRVCHHNCQHKDWTECNLFYLPRLQGQRRIDLSKTHYNTGQIYTRQLCRPTKKIFKNVNENPSKNRAKSVNSSNIFENRRRRFIEVRFSLSLLGALSKVGWQS